MKNLEIIQSTYQGGSSEQNGRNTQKALAAEATWTEAAGFPYAGTYVGFEAIKKGVFDRLTQEWIDFKFTPESYFTSENQVIVLGTYSGQYQATLKAFQARAVHLWTLKDEKVIAFEQIVDSHTVQRVMQ